MNKYDRLLDLLAAHPGADRDELRELADDADDLNPGAVDNLPDDALGAIEVSHADRGDPESEAWQAKQRARFEAYQQCREQALVYVVAYTGLRGSEFLSAPKEDREARNGIRWGDVSFADSSVIVFRKSREWNEASFLEPVIGSLRRYTEVLDVPESWPVFTTLHRPSLASHVSDGLGDAGLDDDETERVRGGAPDLIVAAENDLDAPKLLTTDGPRSIMEWLWTHEALVERRNELTSHSTGTISNFTVDAAASERCLFESSATPQRRGISTTVRNRSARRTSTLRPPNAPTWRPRRSRRRTTGSMGGKPRTLLLLYNSNVLNQ